MKGRINEEFEKSRKKNLMEKSLRGKKISERGQRSKKEENRRRILFVKIEERNDEQELFHSLFLWKGKVRNFPTEEKGEKNVRRERREKM